MKVARKILVLSTRLQIAAMLILCAGAAPVAQASESPYARVCRTAGGQPWTVDFSGGNDVLLCRFGAAAIGAADFAELKWNERETRSVREFLASTSAGSASAACAEHGGDLQTATDSDGVGWQLCAFSDDSVVEAGTLARGSSAASNASLIHALR
jgi:putative hemolysin